MTLIIIIGHKENCILSYPYSVVHHWKLIKVEEISLRCDLVLRLVVLRVIAPHLNALENEIVTSLQIA